MNKIIWLVFLLFVFFLAVASQANAQIVSSETVTSEIKRDLEISVSSKTETSKPKRFYIGLGGMSVSGFDLQYANQSSVVYDNYVWENSGPGADIQIGYAWKYLAVEYGYASAKFTGKSKTYVTAKFFDVPKYYTYTRNYETDASIVASTLNIKLRYPIKIKNATITPYWLIGSGMGYLAEKELVSYIYLDTGEPFVYGKDKYKGKGLIRISGFGVEAQVYNDLNCYAQYARHELPLIEYADGRKPRIAKYSSLSFGLTYRLF